MGSSDGGVWGSAWQAATHRGGGNARERRRPPLAHLPAPARARAAAMTSQALRRLHDLYAVDPFFPFSTITPSLLSAAHHNFLPDSHPFIPSSSCPISFTSSYDTVHDLDIDLFLPSPTLDPFLLHSLGRSAFALNLAFPSPAPRRKCTYETKSAGRKIKWTTEDTPTGDRTFKWEAQIDTPNDHGFHRK
ncbi:hypothetical protein ABZP36_020981 [Zizania latifolia]